MALQRRHLDSGLGEFRPGFDQLAEFAEAERTPIGKDPDQHHPSVPIDLAQPPRPVVRVTQFEIGGPFLGRDGAEMAGAGASAIANRRGSVKRQRGHGENDARRFPHRLRRQTLAVSSVTPSQNWVPADHQAHRIPSADGAAEIRRRTVFMA